MSTERHWLDYEIHLSDQALVEEKQADRSQWNMPRNDPNGTIRDVKLFGVPVGGTGYLFAGPERASREYSNAPLVTYGGIRPTNPPYIMSPWLFPVTSRDRLPTDVDYFKRKSGGWFGIHFLFGDTDVYTWRGTFVYTPGTTPVDGPSGPSLPQSIRRRRWADGFELPPAGAGQGLGESSLGQWCIPAASRHPEGLGLRLCEPSNATYGHTPGEHIGGTHFASWERLYVRVWTRPTAPFEFWKAHNSGGGLNGACLQLLPSGQIGLCDVLNSGVRNLMGTSTLALELGRWYRLDMLFRTSDGVSAGTANFELWINRVQYLNIAGFATNGFAVLGNHADSKVGNELALTLGVCMDLDDWICAERATGVANELGLDWLNGSRVVRLTPDAYGPDHSAADWGANKSFLHLAARPAPELISTESHISTTAGSTMEVVLDDDVVRRINGDPKCIGGGIVALTLGCYQQVNPGGAAGTYAFKRNGGAYDAPVAQPAVSLSLNWDSIAYMPSGLAAPEALTQLSLKYIAGAGAFSRTVSAFSAQAELLGSFDEADTVPTSAGGSVVPQPPSPPIFHNWPYDRTPWSYNTGTPPQSPVVIKSGTFVGNNGITELSFRAPVSFIKIRRVTAAIASNAFWWSTMIAPVRGVETPVSPEQMIRTFWRFIDPPPPAGEDQQEAECIVQIAGTVANATGVTYEYVAFMDPGMRFCMNDAVVHNRGSVDRLTSLFKPLFQADLGMFHRWGHGGSTAVQMYMRGPGHAADDINRFDNVVLANAVNFPQGGVTTRSAFVPAAGATGDQQLPFNLWRRDDLTGDPGIPDTVQILTWTGDGNASRTIGFNGTTKRPLLAIVVGHNGTSITRDPAHTGTTSHQFSTGDTLTLNAATGITAGGAGSMTVGSSLNANGVIYEALVIMGGDTAGNNGWSGDGEFVPVEPVEPPDWPDDDEPIDDDVDEEDLEDDDGDGGGGGDTGDGGGGDPGGVDFGSQCVAASQKVCQQALAFIGINELIVDIVTDNTPQATMCRLFYEDAVNEALREFPWDFATRYADLVHVAGSESAKVNDDWSYSFRVPSDCLFPRRLVRPEFGRKFDPDPPPFRQTGADTTGRLLLTNYRDPATDDDDPACQLEYTYRPGCAAGQGDALFRQALAWLLAHKLAPSLSRNKVTAADCWAMFLHTVNRAATVNARAQQQEVKQGEAEWIRNRNDGGFNDDPFRR